MKSQSYYLVNGITLYRIVAAPVLILLALTGNLDIFKWLLPVSFLTDLLDGTLARELKVTSIFGSKLDSIGDDLSFAAAVVGIFAFKVDFILHNVIIIVSLMGLYLFQTISALVKYGKITSFHTYLAKLAAIFQGCFLVLLFLLPAPLYWLFYTAAILTIIDILEEIIVLIYLPVWESDVKGLYWALRKRNIKRNKDYNTVPSLNTNDSKLDSLHLPNKLS
jgi:phosphatidylglycerophosphate synthase